ncbi:MAG TPA: hypothetical protein VMV66_02920 [Candidatus Humimicrobiaceae bacterium]|nr:hypothetical protein [Candidatus Humimicrobiaceae bacterium]
MPLITQGKTNWKFLLIVVVLAAIVGGGIWWWQKNMPQPEAITMPSQDETADWQTYRNEEYGFEIKYPSVLENGEPGCRVSEVEDTIFIGPISLMFFDTQGLTLDEWIDRKISESEEDTKEIQENLKQAGQENWQEFGSKLLSREEIFVAGEKAIKLSYQFIGAGFDLPVTISVKRGDRIYDFRTNDANLVNEECAVKFGKKPSEAMELMLSTLKFIGEEGTVDWQAYRNEEYGFEIKYPKDWLTEEVKDSDDKLLYSLFYPSGEINIYPIQLSIWENSKQLPIQKWVEGQSGFTILGIKETSEITINGSQGINLIESGRIRLPEGGLTEEWLDKESVYIDYETSVLNLTTAVNHPYFNQMLSTFRFAERKTSATPFINISSPDGGEILKIGENYLITWSCLDVPTTKSYYIARLFLSMDGKMSHGTIDGTPQAYNQIVGCPTDGGKFLWEVGRVERGTILPGDNYQVKIELIEVGNGGEQIIISNVSDNYFSIVE